MQEASRSTAITQLFTAQSLMREEKLDEALLAFAEYLHHTPKDMRVYRLIAEIYRKKGVSEEQLIFFRRSIKDTIAHNEPIGYVFERVATIIYKIAKDTTVVEKFWEFALEQLPEDKCTYNNYANFLLHCGRYEEALPYALLATAKGNTHGDHLSTLGEIYLGMGNTEQAQHICEMLQKEYPEYAPRIASLLEEV